MLDDAARAAADAALGGDAAGYTDFAGDAPCRRAVADAMRAFVLRGGAGGEEGEEGGEGGVRPEDVVLTCGATAAVETVLMALCDGDGGDCFVLPAPTYPAFFLDSARGGVALVTTEAESRITRGALEEAAARAEAQGMRVRGVVLCSPCNPTGRVHSADEVRAVTDFVLAGRAHGGSGDGTSTGDGGGADATDGMHLVWDAVYAGTAYDEAAAAAAAPDVRGDPRLRARVHTVWGISKDFGLSGWRVGACHTRNERLLEALRAQARWASASRLTQAAVTAMLADTARVKRMLRAGAASLGARASLGRQSLTSELRSELAAACGGERESAARFPLRALLPFEPGAGPLDFVDASLGGALRVDEEALWARALELGVSVVRGEGCLAANAGGLRVCWGAPRNDADVQEGARRLARACAEAMLAAEARRAVTA